MQNLMTASEQWRNRPADERFQTLQSLSDSVQARRQNSRSTDIEIGELSIHDNRNTLVLNHALTECEPSHWAFTQLANTLGAPASYLRTLPRPLLVENLTHGLKSADKEAVKFMTIASPEGGLSRLQAVTSTTYGRIWDADCVQACSRIVERSGGKFYNPPAYDIATGKPKPSGLYASDHDVFMFMIDGGSRLEVGERAKLNRGFFMWNSETGARSFGLMTFLFNEVCGNHIVWGAQDINKLVIRHTSGGPARFDAEAMPTLKAYLEASAAPLESALRKAQAYMLPLTNNPGEQEKDIFSFVNRSGKFSRSEVSEAVRFARNEEGDCRTLWHLVQGLTAYARGFDYVDTRVDLEKRAGALLNIVAE
jgi:hypothetical protein